MPNDELIGKRVAFRNPGSSLRMEGTVTGLHWMPAEPGYNPHMVANILATNGHAYTIFLQTVEFDTDLSEQEEEFHPGDATPFRIVFVRIPGGRYLWHIFDHTGNGRELGNGETDSYDAALAAIRRTLGEIGYL